MNAIKNTLEIPKKIRDKINKKQIELQKDFETTFSSEAGARVLKHLVKKVKSDNSDPLNPYAVMRKDACIHLLEVYIGGIIEKK